MSNLRESLQREDKLKKEFRKKIGSYLLSGTILLSNDPVIGQTTRQQDEAHPTPSQFFLDKHTHQIHTLFPIIERESLYRPLVVIYADGLGGLGASGRPFYEEIQKKDLRVEWKQVVPSNPSDPDPSTWKRDTYAILVNEVAKGNDVMAQGYSAGAVLWTSLLHDLTDKNNKEFYNPKIVDRIQSITLYAPPDATDPKSAERPKIKDCINYQRFFTSISPEGVQRIRETFGRKMNIIVGKYDYELIEQGKRLQEKLGATLYEVDSDHGMTGSQNDTAIFSNPQLLAAELFEKDVLTQRKAQLKLQ